MSSLSHLRKWRAKQKSLGLCLDCKRPTVKTLRGTIGVLCEVHRRKNAARLREVHRPFLRPLFPLNAFVTTPALDLSYVGALMDGEGHIGIRNNGANNSVKIPVMSIAMTDREPIEFLVRLFGGRINKRISKRPNRKVAWRWGTSGRKAIAVAKAILPYLKIGKKINVCRAMCAVGELVGRGHAWRIDPERRAMSARREAVFSAVKRGEPWQ